MKLDIAFARYLLRYGARKRPKELKPTAKRLGDIMDRYGGSAGELRTIAVMLVLASEIDDTERFALIEDLICVLEEFPEELSDDHDPWDLTVVVPALIKKLWCVDDVFVIMARHDNPAEYFRGLLFELKRQGVTVPTAEQWTALKPEKPKKGGRKKGKKK